MQQHTSSGAVGATLTEQEMALVTGGDGTLWQTLGFAIGYTAGELLKLNDVLQNPMSTGVVYHLYE
jgi:hypothetical protein